MQKPLLIFSTFLFLGIVFAFVGKHLFELRTNARCHPQNAIYQQSHMSAESRAADLLSRMTEQEKMGQLALVEKNALTSPEDIRVYGLGALLSGAGSQPATNTPADWLALVAGFQAQAKETCLGIPLLYGIDAIHGHAGVNGATVFPHMIGLAASKDADLVRRVGKATAEELAATGIHWNFAPNLDIPKDQRWGRVYETFGSNPTTVTDLGTALLEGLQTPAETYPLVIATAKHFVGNGSMTWGTSGNATYKIDQGDSHLTEHTLRTEDLVPFKSTIQQGALVVMAGLNRWNGKMVTAQHALLTDILKKELGFTGFIVSDWYGVYSINSDRYVATVTGINAGIDMVMLPFEYKLFASDMERALTTGDISRERLDDAVRRILTVKFKAGLFDRPITTEVGLNTIGSAPHRRLAREAVQKSLVVLKNTKGALPLSRSASQILVAGDAANNLGRQAGAWTLEWQGVDGALFPGTTILQGIEETVVTKSHVRYSAHGDAATSTSRADIGIAVVGEKPYAEGVGDDPLPRLSDEDLATIKKLGTQCKTLIVVILSGRALALPAEAASWDAIVAAWLPGSEGQGVADGLFGISPLTGTLPVPWQGAF